MRPLTEIEATWKQIYKNVSWVSFVRISQADYISRFLNEQNKAFGLKAQPFCEFKMPRMDGVKFSGRTFGHFQKSSNLS